MEEREGFEPSELTLAGFQDQFHKPDSDIFPQAILFLFSIARQTLAYRGVHPSLGFFNRNLDGADSGN